MRPTGRNMSFLAASLIVSLCICGALSMHAPWAADEYPNPTKQPQGCGRGHAVASSWVCDPDNVLGKESQDVVEGLLKKVARGEPPFQRVQCGALGERGFQVAVAVTKEYEVPRGSSDEEAARTFARRLHDNWGVGLAECNNGVLLLLSVVNRQLYISTGAGTKARLHYDALGDIIDSAKPLLRSQRYGAAVEQAVLDVGLVLSGQKAASQAAEEEAGNSALWIFLSVVAGFIGLMWWNGRGQRRRFTSCRERLEKLKREQQSARAGRAYEFTSCPVCLEDLQQLPPPTAQVPPLTDPNAPSTSGKAEPDEAPEPSAPPMPGSAAAAPSAAGTASASPSASGSGAGGPPPQGKLPIILPCGHAFCETCIERWLKDKVTCPICRRPVDSDDSGASAPPPGPRPPCNAGMDAGAEAGGMGGGVHMGGMGVGMGSMGMGLGGMGMGSTGFGDPMGMDGLGGMGMGMGGPSVGVGMGMGGPSVGVQFGTPGMGMHGHHGMGGMGYSNTYASLLARQRQLRMMRMGYRGDDLLQAEMAYRVHSLHRQYPDVMTDEMAQQMANDVARGVPVNTAALRTVKLSDPAARSSLAHSGSHGTHSSMGGGRSGGGGGRGGGW